MALTLRKAIVRNMAASAGLCFVLGIGLGAFSGTSTFSVSLLAWPLALALGIGLFSGGKMMAKIKHGVLSGIPLVLSYVRLDRATKMNGAGIDWESIDDYSIQLEARGYAHLGDYTSYPFSTQLTGVATCFLDPSGTTLVEIQHIQVPHAPKTEWMGNPGGVHFSIVSVLAGNIRVATTDHTANAAFYLIRGDNDVMASHPGMTLLPLLEKHDRLLTSLRERTGKSASSGLDMERYILLLRTCFEQARRRLKDMSGYQIAIRADAFDAEPESSWSPTPEALAGLPEGSLADLDTGPGAQGQAPLMEMPWPGATPVNGSKAAANGPASVNGSVDPATLQKHVESAANWFYWIAGLSLINSLIGLLGIDRGFGIGLGMSQMLAGIAADPGASADSSLAITGLLWVGSFAIATFFAACGWLARRPSIVAFTVGIIIFSLDSLISLIAADWPGVAFHALALFALCGGLSVAHKIRKIAVA